MSHPLSKLIKRPHLKATRMLGFALTLNDEASWEGASFVWQVRLTVAERSAIAAAALRSLDLDQAIEIADAVFGGAGAPLPFLLDPVSDALSWASYANPAEIDAYALATFNALSPSKRREFIDFVKEAA
jgi:hypothetical protein